MSKTSLALLLLLASTARADPRTDFCLSLAEVLKTTAIARDQGIPLETVRATLRDTTRTPAQQSALENMVRVIYLRTYTPTQIGENALTQCLAQMP